MALLLSYKLETQLLKKWGLTETQLSQQITDIKMMHSVTKLPINQCAPCRTSLKNPFFSLCEMGVWLRYLIISLKFSVLTTFLRVCKLYKLCNGRTEFRENSIPGVKSQGRFQLWCQNRRLWPLPKHPSTSYKIFDEWSQANLDH